MKTLMMAMLALNFANVLFSTTSQAQEICEECTMKPNSIGTGGLTCAKATAAFLKATGAKDTVATEYAGTVSYTLASEVYCVPHYGMATEGSSAVLLEFSSSEMQDVITGEYGSSVTASLKNIMGSPYINSDDNSVAFTSTEDACFSRYQLVRNQYGNWQYPAQHHYFNYQCRVPAANSESLICKVKYDGRLDIGYQVYRMNGTSGTLPEGIME